MDYCPPEKTLFIRILAIMESNVEDGEWSFNHMLDAVRNWRGFGYRFDIREHIHREHSITEDLVADADEIWFFGTALSDAAETCLPLDECEIKAIAARMNLGVGVFATGDHDSIGACLCGRIPRVAAMRVWGGSRAPASMPPKMTYNSNVRSPYRDIVEYNRRAAGFPAEVETDDHDMLGKQVWAVMHDATGSLHELLQLGYLRPGDRQWIRFLPDHMHEGQLREFDSGNEDIFYKDKNWSADGADPDYKGPLPVIAAYANRTTFDSIGRRSGFLKYPVLSAYESDNDWGNIVVDSTFHHWTDSNALRLRFSPAWLHVEQYAINIANWLLGNRGRQKVKAAVKRYIGDIKDDGAAILVEIERGNSEKAVSLLETAAGRRLAEHRIVVDTLDRILFDCALKGVAEVAEDKLGQTIAERWTLPPGFDAIKLRKEGKLQTVLIALTFMEKVGIK